MIENFKFIYLIISVGYLVSLLWPFYNFPLQFIKSDKSRVKFIISAILKAVYSAILWLPLFIELVVLSVYSVIKKVKPGTYGYASLRLITTLIAFILFLMFIIYLETVEVVGNIDVLFFEIGYFSYGLHSLMDKRDVLTKIKNSKLRVISTYVITAFLFFILYFLIFIHNDAILKGLQHEVSFTYLYDSYENFKATELNQIFDLSGITLSELNKLFSIISALLFGLSNFLEIKFIFQLSRDSSNYIERAAFNLLIGENKKAKEELLNINHTDKDNSPKYFVLRSILYYLDGDKKRALKATEKSIPVTYSKFKQELILTKLVTDLVSFNYKQQAVELIEESLKFSKKHNYIILETAGHLLLNIKMRNKRKFRASFPIIDKPIKIDVRLLENLKKQSDKNSLHIQSLINVSSELLYYSKHCWFSFYFILQNDGAFQRNGLAGWNIKNRRLAYFALPSTRDPDLSIDALTEVGRYLYNLLWMLDIYINELEKSLIKTELAFERKIMFLVGIEIHEHLNHISTWPLYNFIHENFYIKIEPPIPRLESILVRMKKILMKYGDDDFLLPN